MPKGHLAMALAWGYRAEVYHVFIGALRRSGYDGDIAVMVPTKHRLPEAMAVCQRFRVQVVALFNASLNEKGLPIWPSGDRFLMYAKLCTREDYIWCMAADFRDVFFQTNPFRQLPRAPEGARGKPGALRQPPQPDIGADTALPELLLPLESRVIGTCPHNSYAVRKCFGRPAVRAMRNETVICSGVLIGTPDAFSALTVIANLARRCPGDKMSDQASLNYAVYSRQLRHPTGRPLRLQLQPRGASFSNTIGVFKGPKRVAELQRDGMRDGFVLNDDGTPSQVVHQYDRPLKSTGATGTFGRTDQLLRLRVVDDSVGIRPNASWLGLGARRRKR